MTDDEMRAAGWVEVETPPLYEWHLTYRDADDAWQREVFADAEEGERRAREINGARNHDIDSWRDYVNHNVSFNRRPTLTHGREQLTQAIGDPKANGHVDMFMDDLLRALLDHGWKAPGQ